MFASLLNDIQNWPDLLTNPIWLVITAFQIWMLVHAVRNSQWLWAIFIVIGWGITALLYFFFVYRASAPSV
ncbi:MAG TPA: hypothetical protein VF480_03685, partial [Verrucomicrobiae bacterium]